MRNVDSRLTRHVPPPYRWSTEEKALISRAAIKVCSLLLRGGKKKRKIPSSAIHRLCLHEGAAPSNFFISFSGGSAREWNPPLARSCLRATICFYQRLPGDVNSHLPVTKPSFPPPFSFSQGPRAEAGGLVSFGGRRREGGGPKEDWKKELREKRLSFERGEGKKWHACHTSRFPWLRYFLATRIYYSHPTPDSFSLSRLSTLLLPKSGRHNFALVKLEAGSSYVVSSLSLSFLSRWKWKEGFNNRCEFTVYEDDGNRNSNERGREGGISFEQQRFVGQLIIKLLWVITY